MIRTIEVLFAIIILGGAVIATSYFTVLPSPREVSPINLRRLSFTTLQTLDSNYALSEAAFETDNATAWGGLQVALSASLPPNVVYNLTVYNITNLNSQNMQLYCKVDSISNSANLGTINDVSTYTVASSNVTFNVTPEKIGENNGGTTLYILNCSDANGWWITGYTAQSLAQDLYNLLSPYFKSTVMIQNTIQLRQLMDNHTISGSTGEKVQNAVVINTFGESVPMPQEYYQTGNRSSIGYDPNAPKGSGYDYGYVKYCHTLGNTVRLYNWTWASIVGYPFYYVSNTGVFSNGQNGWGVYGMKMTSQGGIRAFLQGLDNQTYHYDENGVASDVGGVTLTSQATDSCNYYGIYPSLYQTSTRALSNSILQSYNLTIGLNIFNPVGSNNPGSIYNHIFKGSTSITGSLLALGLTRTPDVRVTGLSLLSYYQPRLYASEYTAEGTSRMVVLQLGMVGSR
jgi:hypothetical protein